MLPTSCYCIPRSKRHPASRGVEDTLAPREEAVSPEEQQAGAPRPSPGGRSPYLSEVGRPTRPAAASLRLRLRQPLTPAGRRFLLLVSAPVCPHARPALPRQLRISALAVAAAAAAAAPLTTRPGAPPAAS